MISPGSPHVPFGGYKESGFGRDNGTESVDEFTQIKAVYQCIQKFDYWLKHLYYFDVHQL